MFFDAQDAENPHKISDSAILLLQKKISISELNLFMHILHVQNATMTA